MKVIIVVAVCIVGTLGGSVELTEEQIARFRAFKDACLAETGVDPMVAHKGYMEGQWDENDPKLRCFAACMLKKRGVMDDSGNLDEAATRAVISTIHPADKVDEILTKCKDIKGSDACETAFEVVKCYSEIKHAV